MKPGEIHGFLGPNGAGATTMRMIAPAQTDVGPHPCRQPRSRTRAGRGEARARLHSRSAVHLRQAHGRRVPDVPRGLYGFGNGNVAGRVHEMLDLFELRQWEDQLIESFSHGMKQRLVMSSAFLHRPQAVAVDEPMVGLDPRGARLIKDVFRRMSERGVAILMSTHTLEVAQEMCHRVSIIQKGASSPMARWTKSSRWQGAAPTTPRC